MLKTIIKRALLAIKPSNVLKTVESKLEISAVSLYESLEAKRDAEEKKQTLREEARKQSKRELITMRAAPNMGI